MSSVCNSKSNLSTFHFQIDKKSDTKYGRLSLGASGMEKFFWKKVKKKTLVHSEVQILGFYGFFLNFVPFYTDHI